MLLLEAGVLGTFLALDLFLFFVFFEIVLVPMYFLIGGWGHGDRVYAAVKFFLFTMVGSAFMLVGIAGHGRSSTSNETGSRSPSTSCEIASESGDRGQHGPVALPRPSPSPSR